MKQTPINQLTLLAFAHDVTVSAIAWYAAYLLRFNFAIPTEYIPSILQTLAWVTPLQALVFVGFVPLRGVCLTCHFGRVATGVAASKI